MDLPSAALSPVTPLPAAALRRCCDAEALPFATTAELADIDAVAGQERALAAIAFGVGMRREGYNLFALGPEGIGRHTIVQRRLREQAQTMATADDWCYVFDFEQPHKPRALRFPPGRAGAFKAGMQRLVDDLRSALPAALESDEYRNRRNEIESEFGKRQERAIGELGERAKGQGIALVHTPNGFGFVPLSKDAAMSPEEFNAAPAQEQQRLQALIAALQDDLARTLQEMPKWHREALRKLRDLNREISATAIDSLIEDLQAEYRSLPLIADYLARVREDMLEHAEAFHRPKDAGAAPAIGFPLALLQPAPAETQLGRYAVNVLIEHTQPHGAAVVYEDNPSHDAIVGRMEHVSHMGALVTDFTLIKAGALHRANGGFLIVDAFKILSQPYAWDALKLALKAREIRTRPLSQALGILSTMSLEPEPIPLDIKVVLVGERNLYYLLHAHDPEFSQLFKVAVDFEDDVARSTDNDLAYARLVATVARREGLRALDRAAVACVIDQQVRDSGDSERISASMQGLADLLRESDYWAQAASRDVIGSADVLRAIGAKIDRIDRVRDRLLQETLRGRLLVDTAGERSGQVNGLAVVQLGDFAFGTTHRITARTRLGSGGVVDIERESELGGPIHSKGVLILSGFISGRYAVNKPLSLAASLVFEQSYGGVDGDSASSAELYALLSALADAPVRQALAVTGSVNQHGDVQAIGGVNEKVEGFFDLCHARGLSGEQGVLIPESNVRNLMLRQDVIEAVARKCFAIYPVRTIDQGIALLTGVPAETIHARVEERLTGYAERARSFGLPAAGKRRRAQRVRT